VTQINAGIAGPESVQTELFSLTSMDRLCWHSMTLSSPLTHSATAVKRMRPSMIMRGVMLHDNAFSHVACTVQETLCSMHWKVLDHTTYSLNLSPCDFHVFSSLKKALKGCRFGLGEDVEAMMVQWFQHQPREFLWRESISCISAKAVQSSSPGATVY
jgi:hypothetical protein